MQVFYLYFNTANISESILANIVDAEAFCWFFCTKHRQSGLFDGAGQIIEESDQRPSEETPPGAEAESTAGGVVKFG